jgi:hypothetical protein
MGELDMALMTVVGGRHPPSLAVAAEQLGVQIADISESYGVVPVDPDQGLYAVLVRADRLPPAEGSQPFQGPYSNPKIVPFGGSEKK